jgi:dehydrogenase/reductase SDR family protein 7B
MQYDCFKSKFDLVLERFGQIDILINNAGISQRSLIRDTLPKVDASLMNINYLGTITLSKTVLQVKIYFDFNFY